MRTCTVTRVMSSGRSVQLVLQRCFVTSTRLLSSLFPVDDFSSKHIGPSEEEQKDMLQKCGCDSLDALIDKTVPKSIRLTREFNLDEPLGENQALAKLQEMAKKNQLYKSYIGMGYYNCYTPSVIQRNMLENMGWLTSYTPYQAEIAQGRLECLMNFQTAISELTKLEVANASLLDEPTACAEAMALCTRVNRRKIFAVDEKLHPQSIGLLKTRSEPLDMKLIVGDVRSFDFSKNDTSGVIVQFPNTEGSLEDYSDTIKRAHENGVLVVMATDLLALTLVQAPGELGADIALGSTQRFGLPLGYGGPHAAFFAVSSKSARGQLVRQLPGRLVGLSRDSNGNPAYRLTLQTREQHIRREKATSNICTAQALLANISAMYAVYHGPKGLKQIAEKTHNTTLMLATGLKKAGVQLEHEVFFDTVKTKPLSDDNLIQIKQRCKANEINLRYYDDKSIGISMDETVGEEELKTLLKTFGCSASPEQLAAEVRGKSLQNSKFARKSSYLTQEVFNKYHSEQMFVRYLRILEKKDVSLADTMISLGSCTMKLNAAAELLPISWPEFTNIHPFAPLEQAKGYRELFLQLEKWLCEITGYDRFSLMPNSGAQGEYTGLMVIRKYLRSIGEKQRNVCLIPVSAHGTNPASSRMAGLTIDAVLTDHDGNIDMEDLRKKIDKHGKRIAVMMLTYPSTFGVFEEQIQEVCERVHKAGGQIYLDGANMNAQVGLCRPGDYGSDVSHLNLHKTFTIPHGGGGPGMGPIGVKAHLAPFLPTHPVIDPSLHIGSFAGIGPVSGAPWGSASILPISWMYIALMGASGLRRASQVAILNANYMAKVLSPYYKVLYRGKNGFVAHEFILECKEFKKTAGVEPVDIAKRLMDFGFHAPTVSFPIGTCLMVEPTESEDKDELDRFCEALIKIRGEIKDIEGGKCDRKNNVIKNAPHVIANFVVDNWDRPYPAKLAGLPTKWCENKTWPTVGRIDDSYGDMHLKVTLD